MFFPSSGNNNLYFPSISLEVDEKCLWESLTLGNVHFLRNTFEFSLSNRVARRSLHGALAFVDTDLYGVVEEKFTVYVALRAHILGSMRRVRSVGALES